MAIRKICSQCGSTEIVRPSLFLWCESFDLREEEIKGATMDTAP